MPNETSPSSSSPLHTDDLKHLSEGEIYVDENGKKFKVRKSLLSGHFVGGPHGIGQFSKFCIFANSQSSLGDPEDRTLRKIEADVVIPNLMNKKIEKEMCHDFYMGKPF